MKMQSFKMANLKHRLGNLARNISGALPFTKSMAKEEARALDPKTRARTGKVPYGYKTSTVLSRTLRNRSCYSPHQGAGEKARRLAQIEKGILAVG